MTYEGKNFSTIMKLAMLVRQNIHIKNLNLGDTVMPYELKNKIDTSLQVNRSMNTENSFESFINTKLNDNIIEPTHPYRNWNPVLTKDELFCEKYGMPKRTLQIINNDMTLGLKTL